LESENYKLRENIKLLTEMDEIPEREDVTEDNTLLEEEIENLKSELNIKDIRIKNLTDTVRDMQVNEFKLKEDIKNLEGSLKDLNQYTRKIEKDQLEDIQKLISLNIFDGYLQELKDKE
jgi:predicted  nucleic acid-binding Zn-ribbon protein